MLIYGMFIWYVYFGLCLLVYCFWYTMLDQFIIIILIKTENNKIQHI